MNTKETKTTNVTKETKSKAGRKNESVKINSKRLENDIKKIDGERYNQTKISNCILHKCDSYFRKSLKNGSINSRALDDLCEWYGLDKDYYILVDKEPEPTPAEVKNAPANKQDYDNLIVLLMGIDKSLKEISGTLKCCKLDIDDLKIGQQNTVKMLREINERDEKAEQRVIARTSKYSQYSQYPQTVKK